MGSKLSKRSPSTAGGGPGPVSSAVPVGPRGTIPGSSSPVSLPSGSVPSTVSTGPGGAVPGSGLPVSLPSVSVPNAVLISTGGAIPGSSLPVTLPSVSAPSAVSIGPGGAVPGSGLPVSPPSVSVPNAVAIGPGSSLPVALPSVSGFPKFDEDWIRLAIVVHEFSCEAVAWVLDDAICKRHPSLANKDFHERLTDALRLDKPQLSKALLNYQVPTVFPSSGVGKYADFDVGLVRNLIRYFVGNPQWLQATSGLPAVENLKTYNWANASPLALVALLSELRNWIFHNTCGIANFSQVWDDLLNVLHGLKYDTNKVSHFKSGPLDYGSKVVVETFKEALRMVKNLQQELADLEQQVVDVRNEVQKEAEFSKNELITVRDRLERMQTEFKKLQVCQGSSENPISDGFVRAQEACWRVHEDLLKSRELDIYGDQIDGKSKSDMMVSLVTVRSKDVDLTRLRQAEEIEYHLKQTFSDLEVLDVNELFNKDRVVLARGLPGSGKSTFCHFILREWQAGRLWKDRNYDFVFYVNAPFVLNLLHTGPVIADSVLKALYPAVFSEISYEQLRQLNYLVIIDSIDECDVEKICSSASSMTAEFAIKQLIISREKYDRIVVGRPRACDDVRVKLLKEVPFNFIEVVGFSTEQLEVYVRKFCDPDCDKAAVVWKKLEDNRSLFSMAHLPVFANIACNILSEYNSVQIKTQTELYVWAYVVFLTRHLTKLHADVDVSTFDKLFQNDDLLEALKKVSEMAYKNLTGGKIFFKQNDFQLSGIELTLVSSFLGRRQKFLCFAHLTLIEFFSAIYLFINRVKFDQEILRNEHLRGVFHMYFGLLGASARNSDSPEIICIFVHPLIKKFNLRPIDKHPLSGNIGRSVFEMYKCHDLFVNLTFEFRNPQLLRGEDVHWENDANLQVRHHHQLDACIYLLDNLIHDERTVGSLLISPTDHELSLTECEKVRDCLKRRGENVNWLRLWLISPTSEQMEVFGEVCSLVSTVQLRDIHATSEGWMIFHQSVKKAKQNRTFRLKQMGIFECYMDEAIRSELKELGIGVWLG